MPAGTGACERTNCRYYLSDKHGRPSSLTCAIEGTNQGPHTLEWIARVMGLTRVRVLQIEALALQTLRQGGRRQARVIANVEHGSELTAELEGAEGSSPSDGQENQPNPDHGSRSVT